VFGDVGPEGPLGLEDSVAEVGFKNGLRLRREGYVEFCSTDMVDDYFATI